MIPSMIFLGLGLKPFYILSFSAQILLIVVIMMPTTPGSSGVAEGLIAGLYSVYGTPKQYPRNIKYAGYFRHRLNQ